MPPELIVALMSGGGFTFLLWLAQWLAGAGERRRAEEAAEALRKKSEADKAAAEADARAKAIEVEIKQRQYIEDRSTSLAVALREELRAFNLDLKKDNEEMRARVRQTELDLEATKTHLATVAKDNDILRRENLELATSNGALKNQVEQQGKEIVELRNEIKVLREDRLTLMDAMRRAGVTIPPLTHIG